MHMICYYIGLLNVSSARLAPEALVGPAELRRDAALLPAARAADGREEHGRRRVEGSVRAGEGRLRELWVVMNPPKPKDKFFTRISVSSGKLGTSSGFGVRLRARKVCHMMTASPRAFGCGVLSI